MRSGREILASEVDRFELGLLNLALLDPPSRSYISWILPFCPLMGDLNVRYDYRNAIAICSFTFSMLFVLSPVIVSSFHILWGYLNPHSSRPCCGNVSLSKIAGDAQA